MKKIFTLYFFTLVSWCGFSQVSTVYTMRFTNAVHHEAAITAEFKSLEKDTVVLTMARTSPGRYALHEFVKNVYDLKVTDGDGNPLTASRKDPYSWTVTNHNGSIKISYTLFANHGDGTYSQIDETHAHLNMPATFMYVPELKDRAIEVTFETPEDLNWKVATQLKKKSDSTFYAPNLQYFLDSPTELSDHDVRGFMVGDQRVKFVLHHNGTPEELDQYFEKVKAIVLEQKAIFKELPKFDYGTYQFLACYLPHVDGDGMEHRNSTVLTSTRSLSNEGLNRNIGTVSHEFFHCWNVERIRPLDIEPFDFTKADMSGALWFAEGFTSYYTNLTLVRAGLISQAEYIDRLPSTFNYVWNSPGLQFYNPIEMSNQAPFVDAAKSVDPTNRTNTFVSYYSYGSMLGLALDLSLREIGLNLDEYMQLLWFNFGKEEIPYTIKDLQKTLMDYAGKDFGISFFENYIFQSKMPDMKRLLTNVGVDLSQKLNEAYIGAVFNGSKIAANVTRDAAAYKAGLELGDEILQIETIKVSDDSNITDILRSFQPNETINIKFRRRGVARETTLTLEGNPTYVISLFESKALPLSQDQKDLRNGWLGSKL